MNFENRTNNSSNSPSGFPKNQFRIVWTRFLSVTDQIYVSYDKNDSQRHVSTAHHSLPNSTYSLRVLHWKLQHTWLCEKIVSSLTYGPIRQQMTVGMKSNTRWWKLFFEIWITVWIMRARTFYLHTICWTLEMHFSLFKSWSHRLFCPDCIVWVMGIRKAKGFNSVQVNFLFLSWDFIWAHNNIVC